MAERASYSDILDRLRKASGASREIDARLWRALFPDQRILTDPGSVRERREASYGILRDLSLDGWSSADWDGVAAHIGAERVTASFDAAMSLVERVLPGWTIASVGQNDDKTWHAELREGYLTSYHRVTFCIKAQSAPLALLIALFEALKQKEDGK